MWQPEQQGANGHELLPGIFSGTCKFGPVTEDLQHSSNPYLRLPD